MRKSVKGQKIMLRNSLIILLIFICSSCYASERQIIAEVLAAEAGGEGLEGLLLVAETIRNRSEKSGRSYFYEATKQNQYYGYTAKNRTLLYLRVKSLADKATDILFSGKLGDKTSGALYFINHNTEKPFKWCKVFTYKFGNHSFFK